MFDQFLPKRKIGYLFPLSIIDNLAYQFYRLAPDGMMMILLPVGLREFTLTDVERAFAPLEDYIAGLLKQEVNIIVQGGVPPALLMGLERHDTLLARIKEISGLAASSTTLNVVAAAKSLGIKHIACANKWNSTMNNVLTAFFAREGIQVAGISSKSMVPDEFLKMKGGEGLQLAYELGRGALKENPDADGLYIGGSAWLTFPIVEPLEKEFGKPVVTNANATLWHLCHLLDYWKPIRGYGRLLESS
jgi:maleate cis-trans isomerase